MKRRIIKLHKITITLSEIIIKFGVTWWEASFAVRLFLLPVWHPALRHGGGTDHELTNWELDKEDGVVEIDVPQ